MIQERIHYTPMHLLINEKGHRQLKKKKNDEITDGDRLTSRCGMH